MISRYGSKSFNETKQPKLGYFQYWSIRMISFTKKIAQQHFVYLIFQRHKILSNQKLNTSPNHKLWLISIPQNHFTGHLIPGKWDHINRPFVEATICFSRLTRLVEYSSDFAYRSHKRDSKPGLNIFLNRYRQSSVEIILNIFLK